MKNEMSNSNKQNIIYQLFRCYLRFVHDRIFYKKVHRIGTARIPQNGKPLLLVSNHQNCLNDPLGLILTFRDRKPHILARADVIEYNWLTNKFLRGIGLLPAFRLDFDGEDSLSRNADSFAESENALLDGDTIIMYPEGRHQDKRWLGPFSSGFTKMAFEAAQKSNFEKEVFIQPSCNHYSDYYGIQNEIVLQFGNPISIAPYYELYKTKPRTAQRQVIEAVRNEIAGMMLNITDLDNYAAIDFIRNVYGPQYALHNGLNPRNFPDMLQSDKQLVAALDTAHTLCTSAIDSIYTDALTYKQVLEQHHITDNDVARNASVGQIAANIFSLLVFLPVWIISLWPNLLIYCLPNIFIRRLNDKMFEGTIRYSMSVLLTIPVLYTAAVVITLILTNFWVAFFHLCLLPALAVFAWNYWQFLKRTFRMIRFRRLSADKRQSLNALRESIVEKLDNLLGTRD